MIKIKKEKEAKTPKKKSKPYYMLKINYMIGDSNGYTTEKGKISEDNPYLEPFLKILDKLQPPKGHWGIVFRDIDNYSSQLTDEEFKLFENVNCLYDIDEDELDDKSLEYLEELSNLIRDDIEYSFLVYQDYELIYVDEFKKKHETIITK